MERTRAVVVGAGQAGLAASRCLSERGVEHVVLERGRVAERWRRERWDSLHLLTPRWQSRLPGYGYRGPDPDGFMSMSELVEYLEAYARTLSSPLREHTVVERVLPLEDGFQVATDREVYRADSVVIATGACQRAYVPKEAERLHASIEHVVPAEYRRPSDLPGGGVLVVGAGATGVQLADEIHRSGRPVTLAVGKHVRMPRRYRGADIMRWLDAAGILDRRFDQVRDLAAARRTPSLQLVGRDDQSSLDLAGLQRLGVRLCGRFLGVDGSRASFADDLARSIAEADLTLSRVLDRLDAFIERAGLSRRLPPRPSFPSAKLGSPITSLDLTAGGIRAVVWATGYVRRYPFFGRALRERILDRDGELRQEGGVTSVPGLYALGLPFLRRRKSTFIDGVGEDAHELAELIAARPHRRGVMAA